MPTASDPGHRPLRATRPHQACKGTQRGVRLARDHQNCVFVLATFKAAAIRDLSFSLSLVQHLLQTLWPRAMLTDAASLRPVPVSAALPGLRTHGQDGVGEEHATT